MKRLKLHSKGTLLGPVGLSSIVLLIACVPSRANLGDTPEQVKARYGEVIYKFEGEVPSGFVAPVSRRTLSISTSKTEKASEKSISIGSPRRSPTWIQREVSHKPTSNRC